LARFKAKKSKAALIRNGRVFSSVTSKSANWIRTAQASARSIYSLPPLLKVLQSSFICLTEKSAQKPHPETILKFTNSQMLDMHHIWWR
jgi:hypothetical protein